MENKIIEELKEKIDNLNNQISSQNLILKAQANRLNEISIQLQALLFDKKPEPKLEEKKPKIKIEPAVQVPISSNVTVIEENNQLPNQVPLLPARHNRKEAYAEENDFEEFLSGEKKEEQQVTNVKNINISQRIVDANQKSIYLAAVEIRNPGSKENIVRVLTTPNGKWKASLPPGKYEIFIKKQTSLNRPRLEHNFEINLTNDKNDVELETIKLI